MKRKIEGVLKNNIFSKVVKKVHLSEPFYLQYLMQKRVIELVIDVDLNTFDHEVLHEVHMNLKYFRIKASNENLQLFNKLLNTDYKNHIINYNQNYVPFKLLGKLFSYDNFDVFVCERRYYLPSNYMGFSTGVYKGKTILYGGRINNDFWPTEKHIINRNCNIGSDNQFRTDLITGDDVQVKFNENTINIYIYDVKIKKQELVVKAFEYGYVKGNEYISVTGKHDKVTNSDHLLYSKLSHDYSENFYTYKFSVGANTNIIFSNQDYNVRLHAVKNAYNYLFKDNIAVNIEGSEIKVEYDMCLEEKYESLINPKYNNVVLFQDRNQQAGDNAEALYRHVMTNNLLEGYECYFVLDETCSDYERLEKEGFNLLAFGSELHREIYVNCQMICSSHAAKRIYSPFYNRNYEMITRYKFVFLQHGIIMGNHQGFLDVLNNKIDLFITSTECEQKLVKSFSMYENVVNTGLARFDKLENNNLDYILYAPSWNVLYRQDFINGDYYKEVVKVLELCCKKQIHLKLLLHPEFINYHHYFTDYQNEYIEVIKPGKVDYHHYITTCSALITDYSSILWDILYLEKQLFLHKPYELHHDNDINNEYLNYGFESYNISELADNITKFNDKNDNPIFNRDKKCCDRIIGEVIKLLKGD